MAKEEVKLVTVTVAKGKSIQQRITRQGTSSNPHGPVKQFMPGEQCQVPASDVPRLIKQGFIVNPDEKPLPKDAGDVDISGYLQPSEGAGPKITAGGAAA